MKKLNLIFTVTLIISIIYCKQSRADDSGSCGENCTWEVIGNELKIYGTGNMNSYNYYNSSTSTKAPWNKYKSSIKKITIEEGITSIGDIAFHELSQATSIKLPSTLKTIGTEPFRDSGIHSIELPEGLERLEKMALTNISGPIELPSSVKYVGSSNRAVSIINANSNTEFAAWTFRGWNGAVADCPDIKCKGDIKVCENVLQNVKSDIQNIGKEFHLSYYAGEDGNGNWEEWSDDGKAIYTDSTKAKLLETYDFDGNQTASYNYSTSGQLLSANTYDSEGNVNGSYTYDTGGNLISAYQNGKAIYQRKIYTIEEADAATKKGNVNKLTITW